jgi:hypothetical protein
MEPFANLELDSGIALALGAHPLGDFHVGRAWPGGRQVSCKSSTVRLHPGSTISSGAGRSAPRIQAARPAT